jgi:hypothetical protein
MPTLEAPNKPKKYEVVEYPAQKVGNLEQKRQESQALFETLSLEDREKYNEAYAEFAQKANFLGYDVSGYDMFFDELDWNGSFNTSGLGKSHIMLDVDFISKSSKLSIKQTLFHELIGHCLSSKNMTKFSDTQHVHTGGLKFSRTRWSELIPVNKEIVSIIAQKLRSHPDLDVLGEDELKIVNKLSEIFRTESKIAAIITLSDSYDEFPSVTSELEDSLSGSKVIGEPLNEGVTDYLAINMTTDDSAERVQLLCASGYYDYVEPFYEMKEYLDDLKVENNAWDDCLYSARLTGQPYKIIKFLKDKTGITITPKELFALDFRKILKEEVKNNIDNP